MENEVPVLKQPVAPESPLKNPAKMRTARLVRLLVVLLVVLVGLPCAVIVADGLHDRPGRSDLAVVLGNKVETNGQPSPRLAARLDSALELWRRGLCGRILVSGGVGVEGFDEAAVMKSYLVAHGVPHAVVVTDSTGYDTYRTAFATAKYMTQNGLRTATIVTQFFHVTRTRVALQRFGVACPNNVHARFFEWRALWQVLREVGGLWFYLLRSYNGTSLL